ncbi:MAG: MFS transporter [Chloroflexi bacterium]|nr:MFS transporter [Chloroflexota bacterium]
MHDSFAALRVRNYAILWTGSLATFTAFFMSTIVQAIVAFDITGKNGSVGFVLLGQGISMALLGPLGGAVADRASKRLISIVASVVITGVFLVTGLLLATDQIAVFHLAAGAFVIGTMFAFMGPARQAWVAELVGEDLRGNAVALNQVALNAARIWAPAIGGLLVAVSFIGAAGAYFLMAFLYGLSGLSLLLLPDSRRAPGGTGRSVFGDIVDGFQYVQSQPRLRWMLILFFSMIVLGLTPTAVVLPGLLENVLGEDVNKFGLLQTISAVGGLAASLAVAGIASSPRALTIYSAGALLTGVALVFTGLAPSLAILFVPMFLTGLGTGAFQTLNSAVIVIESEPAYYGRVTSLTGLAFAGFMLAGYPVGLAADAFGERATTVVMGIATVVLVLLISPLIARSKPIQSAGERQRDREAAAAGGG